MKSLPGFHNSCSFLAFGPSSCSVSAAAPFMFSQLQSGLPSGSVKNRYLPFRHHLLPQLVGRLAFHWSLFSTLCSRRAATNHFYSLLSCFLPPLSPSQRKPFTFPFPLCRYYMAKNSGDLPCVQILSPSDSSSRHIYFFAGPPSEQVPSLHFQSPQVFSTPPTDRPDSPMLPNQYPSFPPANSLLGVPPYYFTP